MVPTKVCVDLDGTADSDPALYSKIMRAFQKRGDKVIVLTGCPSNPITQADVDEKAARLRALGLGDCYDKLKVVSNPSAKPKAAYCEKHDVRLLIDNSMVNAQLAPCGTYVLVPWRSLSS